MGGGGQVSIPRKVTQVVKCRQCDPACSRAQVICFPLLLTVRDLFPFAAYNP